jgi:cytoskeletal protein CcmA (bactofilin family)
MISGGIIMGNEIRHNLKIAGEGTASGGFYNNISVSGKADINGDFDCIDFRISGACDINGNLKTKTGKISGEVKVKGNLEAEEFKISGSSDIDGDAVIKKIKIQGGTKIGGNISSEEVSAFGEIKINGDCNAETFVSKGAFTIGGLLNAGEINIVLYSRSNVSEIGGEKITIKKGITSKIKNIIKSIFLPNDFFDGRLYTESIEGDDIYLEYTKAKVVRGNNVTIGEGCEIELVEYKDSFEQLGNCKVLENKKL